MGKAIHKSEYLITDKKRALILINIIITCFSSSMMSTALTAALPQIISDLSISASTGQWLSSNMKKEYTAHATALLTALRTISGAIGMSVFIGIMTPSANSNTSLSYIESSMEGLNIAFLFMGIVSIILLGIAIFRLKKDVSDELYEVSENAL